MIRHDEFERASQDFSASGLDFSRKIVEADWSRQQTFASNMDKVYLPKNDAAQGQSFGRQLHQYQQQQAKHSHSHSNFDSAFSSSLTVPIFGTESSRPGILQPMNRNNGSINNTNGHQNQNYGQHTVVSVFNASLDESKESTKSSPVPSSDASHASASLHAVDHKSVTSLMNSIDLGSNHMKKEYIPTNMSIHSSRPDGQNAIYFAFYVPSGNFRQNDSTMMRDLKIKISIRLYSPKDGPTNIKTVYTCNKWYSELKSMHESLGFLQNIQFPNITDSAQTGDSSAKEHEMNLIQNYLNSLAKYILNCDLKSQRSIAILNSFEDENYTLSDKMKLVMQDMIIARNITTNEMLQNKVISLDRINGELNQVISMMNRRLEQLETSINVTAQRQDQTTPTPTKVFSSQPSSPSAPTSGMYYSKTQPIPVSLKSQESGVGGHNVIIEFAEIDPNTLVNIADQILLEKGPLPVGEVGKMLQEATGNLQLSQMLKEKHNGLKKFLEKYSDKFIMSNDHPFNPHVYLRRCFSAEEQRLIENGCKVFLDEFKKNKKSRRNNTTKTKSWPTTANTLQSTGLTGFQHNNYS